MSIKTLIVSVLLSATAVLAQDISTLPACAQVCLTTTPTACSTVDVACRCADTKYFSQVQTCVLGSCSLTDAITTLNWSNKTCPK